MFAFAAFFLTACSATRRMEQGERLLVKNDVTFERKTSKAPARKLQEPIQSIIAQQPNKKLFGLWRVRLGLHTWAVKKEKDTKFRNWVAHDVGEAPVVYEHNRTLRSAQRINTYLTNNGYFHNEVQVDTFHKGRKKIKANYLIKARAAYHLDTVQFPDTKNHLAAALRSKKSQSLLRSGDRFSVDLLDEERRRIASVLKDFGYFKFNKEFVHFELDSSAARKTVDVDVQVKLPLDSTPHRLYFIDKIKVVTDYQPNINFEGPRDTLNFDGIQFLSYNNKYRLKVLAETIFFEKGKIYSLTAHTETLDRLTNLGVFKFINIKFNERVYGDKRLLDVIVQLSPAKKQSIAVSLEASSRLNEQLGAATSFTYRNRNLFKSADLLLFNLSAGLESSLAKGQSFINTADFSGELSYYFNRFLVPFSLAKEIKRKAPKTRFSLRYSFQSRFDKYDIHALNAAFGYEWAYKERRRHILEPISANLFIISNITNDFQELLDDNPRLENAFEEKLILGSNYTFVFSNRNDTRDRRFTQFTGNIDVAGNALNGAFNLLNSNQEQPYQLGNREFAQFIKTEADVRNYRKLGDHGTIVYRLNLGAGVPIGNSDVLPFIKQFYSGGTNGVRAFAIRELGPGGYSDSISANNNLLDQTGELKFESNLEMRFDIYRWIKGALFTDAGNVWLLQADSNQVLGEFQADRFYREIALGAGAGLRLDFDFFVLRFDIAFPLRNPALPAGDRWTAHMIRPLDAGWRRDNLRLNLAIGYPF